VICEMRESLCMALEARRVAPWMKVLWCVHWLYMSSTKALIRILVHWEGLKVLNGTLFGIKVDIAAPQ
jgi:hypothetical protein